MREKLIKSQNLDVPLTCQWTMKMTTRSGDKLMAEFTLDMQGVDQI